MTYEVYAMFREGAYLVCTSTDREIGLDFAEHICKGHDIWPMGFVSGTRSELNLNCEIFTFDQLKARSK
jgi:hypothetical protein